MITLTPPSPARWLSLSLSQKHVDRDQVNVQSMHRHGEHGPKLVAVNIFGISLITSVVSVELSSSRIDSVIATVHLFSLQHFSYADMH